MTDEKIKNPRGAGRKPAPDGATSFLHIRCKPAEKSAWVKAAYAQGGLSEWVIRQLNEAALKNQG